MIGKETAGWSRMRLVISAIGAVVFGYTAVGQFRAEANEYVVMGALFSGLIGFVSLFVIITIIMFVMKLIKRG